MDSLVDNCSPLTPWNIGGSWGRHGVELCGASGVQFYGSMSCLVALFMDPVGRSMGYVHARPEKNTVSYHINGWRASSTVQCGEGLQRATHPSGTAMCYSIDRSPSRA